MLLCFSHHNSAKYVSPHSILTLVPLISYIRIIPERPVKVILWIRLCHAHVLMQFKCPTSIAKAHLTPFSQLHTNYCWDLAHSALMYSRVPRQHVFSCTLVRCILSDDRCLCLLCPCVCLCVHAHMCGPCTYTMSYDFTSWFETVVQRLK